MASKQTANHVITGLRCGLTIAGAIATARAITTAVVETNPIACAVVSVTSMIGIHVLGEKLEKHAREYVNKTYPD